MWTTLFLVASLGAIWFILRREAVVKLNMPYVQFDGDNSDARYISETKSLMERGYYNYIKSGQAFAIRNPVDEKHPQVILPMKYLDQVRNAPQSIFDFYPFLKKASVMEDIHGCWLTNTASDMVRVELTKALTSMIPSLDEECSRACDKIIPPCEDWSQIMPFQVLLPIFAYTTAVVLYGTELCHDEDWMGMILAYIPSVMMAPISVTEKYHPSLRWLAKYFDTPTKSVIQLRRRAGELLQPILATHAKGTASGKTSASGNAIQWLISRYQDKGKVPTLDDLAQDILFVTVAATQTTPAVGTSILFDLMDRPDSVTDIQEEISQVYDEKVGWTRNSLADLKVLDSFMKESKRVHTFTQVTVEKMAMQSHTFDDGLHIPAETQISFPNQQLNLDDDITPDAKTFDPRRWLRMRQGVDRAKFHFASVSDNSITWGSGYHACPGRFLAQDTLKLMFTRLLTHYEFKYLDGTQERPPDMYYGFGVAPNMATPILIRKKSSISK